MDKVGAELGFFAFFSMLAVAGLMNKLDGRIFRLRIFMTNREFHLLERPKFKKMVNLLLRALSWIFVLMPFIALGVWTAGLLIKG